MALPSINAPSNDCTSFSSFEPAAIFWARSEQHSSPFHSLLPVTQLSVLRIAKAFSAFEEINMEDFPIWLKLVIWGTIGLTVLYTIWGMIHSFLQS